MRGSGFPLLSITLIALALWGTATAQNVGDNSVYFVTYYSNSRTASAPDQTVRIINDGDTEANLWASFYVFDDSQEMQECCSCEVTPDGLLSESVDHNLNSNSLTGQVNAAGVIKVISSSVAATGPANFFAQGDFSNTPTPGLRVWSTHIQRTTPTTGSFYVSETTAASANLAASEKSMLETLCLFINLLGSGNQGVCSCQPEDYDF